MSTTKSSRATDDTAAFDPADAGALRVAVMRISRQLRQEAMERGGLTPSKLTALATIEREGPLPLGELAEREKVAAPTITRIVEGLESAGLITRRNDPGDRRVVLVAATAKGRSLVRESRRRHDAVLARRIAQLEAHERTALIAAIPVLQRLHSLELDDA